MTPVRRLRTSAAHEPRNLSKAPRPQKKADRFRGKAGDPVAEGESGSVAAAYPSGGAVTVNLAEEGARGAFGRNGDTTVTVELRGMNKNGAVLGITSSS